MIISKLDLNHSLSLLVVLTLARGHKVTKKQSLFSPFSCMDLSHDEFCNGSEALQFKVPSVIVILRNVS